MRWLLCALAAALLATVLLRPNYHASAGAERTLLPVSATATIHTELFDQLVVLTGWLDIERSAPRYENGFQVEDLSLPDLHLQGASPLGLLVVTPQPADSGHVSTGEVRSLLFQEFPAFSFLDLYVDVAAPNTNIGLVTLRNDEPLHLLPGAMGQQHSINDWPPLGETYHLTSGCVPLISQNPDLTLNACVSALDVAVAPALASFAVGRDGPSHLHPADIFGLTPSNASTTSQAPFLRVPCANLGLTADGCDDGVDGTQDAIDALSYGRDFAGDGTPRVFFSVAPGAQGATASSVRQQVECPPSAPGLAPEPESDVFSTTNFDGSNALAFDGNGPVGTCPPAFPLGLIEAPSVRDNLDALDLQDPSMVDADGNGVPDLAVYFSLDAASPSLATYGFSPADVLRTVAGAAPRAYALAANLGLRPGDDVDGLCLRDNGDGAYGSGDLLYFSLTAGSPTLAGINAGPGDILAPGSPPTVVRTAASLGLAPGDALDALACPIGFSHPSNGDVNCDGGANSADAALVLRYGARLIGDLPCFDNADVRQDGRVNSIDALLILQFDAGLIGRLPP